MAQRPVIFLAFANNLDSHLDTLRSESRGLDRALYPLHDKQFLELHVREGADIQDVFTGFNRFNHRVAIFHYGGHANGTHLHLEGETADASGLATLMGQQEQLRLVFLNGCSTRGQVKALLRNGVKAVIATSVAIEDNMATEFSIQFYQNLAHKQTIEQAYNQALAYLKTKYAFSLGPAVVKFRDFIFDPERGIKKELPWGLYLNEGAEEVLKWKLPFFEKVQLPDGFGSSLSKQYRVNEYILSILEVVAEHVPTISVQMKDRYGNPRDPRELPSVLIENFPWPLGSQLRILFVKRATMNHPGMPRLRQLLSTYLLSCQFIVSILVSQIWDEMLTGRMSPSIDLMSLVPKSAEEFKNHDFMKVIRMLNELLLDAKIDPFLEELSVFFQDLSTQEEAYQSYEFIEQVMQQVANELIGEDALEELCNQVEFCLSTLLKKLAFLAKYQLVTVKDIGIYSPKRETPSFAHYLGYLNAPDAALLSQSHRSLKKYTNSHSVLLVKSGDMQEFLNLSPFIVDKNAFEKESESPPNIYVLAWEQGGGFTYTFVNHSIYESLEKELDQLHTNDPQYVQLGNLIERQFALFREDIDQTIANL